MTKRLQIDYQRFVVGDLPMPPSEQREAAQALLRSLRQRAKSVSERFRIRSLESKLNSHVERYSREVRKWEQSSEGQPVRRAEPKPDPYAGVVVGPRASQAAEQALYEVLYPARTDRRPKVDLARFRAHLRRNVEIIQAKTGCREVSFRITVEDGKTKLKAKPIPAAG